MRHALKIIIAAGALASLAAVTTIRWTDIRSTDRHGNASHGQASDNTGTSGNLPKFDANGNITDSGVAASSITANYSQSFTSQTSVVLAHNLNTSSVIVGCYDGATPPNRIEPLNVALTDANDVTVTFSTSQSGKCIVNGLGGSSLVTNYFGGIPTLTSPGAPGAWTWVNQGTASVAASNGGLTMTDAAQSGGLSALQVRALVVSAPSTPYEYVAAVGMTNPATTNWDAIVGIVARDSASGKLFTCEIENNNCGNGGCTTGGIPNFPFTSANYWSSSSVLVSDQVIDYYRVMGWSSPILLKYGDNGTNRYCSISMDGGNNWTQFVNQSRTTNVTANQIGWFAADVGATTSNWAAMLMSWLRTI